MSTDLSALHAQVEILRWCKAKRAEIKELEDQAKSAIQAVMGNDDTGTMNGATVVTWKSHKRTALDQGYLKKHHPEIYAESVATTEVRRFEVTD